MLFSEQTPASDRNGINSGFPQGTSHTLREILEANRAYAENFGDKARLIGAPRRRMAILTCMDARMDPAKFSGLNEGDAHVIRNAGGRASDDAIRSLVVSCKLMGTTDWFVIHHSGCGMQSYTDDEIRHLLGLDTDEHPEGSKWHDVKKSAQTPADIHWLTFSDLVQSIVDDVKRIRQHPLVPPSVAICGYIYHIHHGMLEPVPEANRIGAPQMEPA
ncbi:MAG: carbonic anhydrase [Methylacidiphilales bacterium]|nr:carbonic anhydrase [Candidatus Methylacidiphilales bacterium]